MAGLREILVSFGIDFDTSPLDKGNAKVESGLASLKKFGAALAGAFAVTKIAGFVNEQVKLGDELGDQAVLLGLSTKSLEQWKYAAQFAEISGEELSGMFMRVSRSAKSAEDAGSANGKALKKLGVNVKDYQTSADVFEAIGTKLAGMKEGYERTALAAQFFGKAGGAKILQLFKDGKDGIAKYREEFELLGGGMGDFAKQAGDVDDAEKRLNFAWGVTKTRIAGVFLPALEWGIGKLTKFAAAATRLIDGTHLLGTALTVLGALAVAAAVRIVAAYLPVIAPFLMWAAAIAAVILIFEDLWGFFEGRRSAFGRVLDAIWGPGTQEKVRAWCFRVRDFVVSLIDQVKSIFGNGQTTIQQKFQALLDYFAGKFREGARAIFGDVAGDVIAVFLSATTEIISLFVDMATAIGKVLETVGKAVGKLTFGAVDGAANEQAKLDAAAAGGQKPATASDLQAHLDAGPWYMRAFAKLSGFDPSKSVPVAPGGAGGVPPVINNITVPPGTSESLAQRVGAAAHKGTAAALQAPNRAAAAGLGRKASK